MTLPHTPQVPTISDPLAEALHYLRMDGMFYCKSELTTPWGLLLPPMPDCLWFHVITAGECVLTDSQERHYRVRRGDIVVLPHGAGHRAAEPGDTATPMVLDLPHEYISRQYAILRHGGDATRPGAERTDLVCGVVQFDHPAARFLTDMLPEIIHIDAAHAAAWHWFPSLLALMSNETQAAQPGGEAVVTRLCDILVIQAIRWWIDNDPNAHLGWLGALRDPAIGESIAAIHRDPSNDWSVQSLAEHAAMSRSAFSAKFGDLVGEAPMSYVTRWRMYVAVDLLRDQQQSIAEVASQTGYQSEASFSRAFKRVMGHPPSAARQALLHRPAMAIP